MKRLTSVRPRRLRVESPPSLSRRFARSSSMSIAPPTADPSAGMTTEPEAKGSPRSRDNPARGSPPAVSRMRAIRCGRSYTWSRSVLVEHWKVTETLQLHLCPEQNSCRERSQSVSANRVEPARSPGPHRADVIEGRTGSLPDAARAIGAVVDDASLPGSAHDSHTDDSENCRRDNPACDCAGSIRIAERIHEEPEGNAEERCDPQEHTLKWTWVG